MTTTEHRDQRVTEAENERYRETLARIIVEPARATYLAYIALNDPENAVVAELILRGRNGA